LFSVLDRRANVFSQGNFFVTGSNDEIIDDDPLTKLINNPNPQQARFEFLYNHLVYKGLGNNYINVKTSRTSNPRNIDSASALFNLNQDFINFNNVENITGFVFAQSDVKKIGDIKIQYVLNNKQIDIPIRNLIVYNDLPNGIKNTNLIQGCSRVEALIPSLSNIAETQSSKNINLNLGGTFVMSNEKKIDGNNTPLPEDEKHEIEALLNGKKIIATKTSLKGFRIANDLDNMIFDEQFAGEMMKITQAYGMDNGVMDYLLRTSSLGTNDNEKSVAQWIQDDIQFEGKIFSSTLQSYFEYEKQGKKVHMTFDHLPAMQVLEKERADKMKLKADTLKILVDTGIDLNAALSLLDIELNENLRQ